MLAGLLQLLTADTYARELKRPSWDFAVEISSLRAAGLTSSDLRWLVCKEYVEHAVETTPAGSATRSFGKALPLTFSDGSCFLLTANGVRLVRTLARRARIGQPANDGTQDGVRASPSPQPRWDPARRALRVGDQLVKQFRVPAQNQELILAALEELGWPPHIDDPLPPVPDLDSKQRLRDTISRLNHHQKHDLIRFDGDGHGRGIQWELLG
jgi:hypothetical protein